MNIILYLFLSFIISLFTMFYYQIKHKFISFLSLSFILFLSLLLFRNEHIIVIYLSLFLEINLFLHITHQTDTSEHFIMTTLLFITLMIAKISAISLFLLLTSYSLNDVLKNTNYLNFMQLIECLIFSLFCIQIYLLKIKNILKIYNSKKQDIQFFLFSIFILLSLIVQSIYNASFPSKTLFLLSLLLIVSFLFILCIYERIKTIVEDNNELLLNEQKQKYSLLNKNTIMKSNDEIKRLEHRMLYSLMQIKNQIKEKNYDNVIYSIDEYLNKIKYNKYSIITNNPYFDYVFCQLIDQLNQKKYSIKIISTIDNLPILDDQLVIQNLIFIIQHFSEISFDHDLSISFIDRGDSLVFELSTSSSMTKEKIENEIFQYINAYDYQFESIDKMIFLKIIFQE